MVRTQTRTRTAISTTDGAVVRRVKSELDELRGYQGQFWLNFAAMFFYLASSWARTAQAQTVQENFRCDSSP